MSNAAYKHTLVKIHECETQVVKGINYKMKIETGGAKNGKTMTKVFTVYRDLNGAMTFKGMQ